MVIQLTFIVVCGWLYLHFFRPRRRRQIHYWQTLTEHRRMSVCWRLLPTHWRIRLWGWEEICPMMERKDWDAAFRKHKDAECLFLQSNMGDSGVVLGPWATFPREGSKTSILHRYILPPTKHVGNGNFKKNFISQFRVEFWENKYNII